MWLKVGQKEKLKSIFRFVAWKGCQDSFLNVIWLIWVYIWYFYFTFFCLFATMEDQTDITATTFFNEVLTCVLFYNISYSRISELKKLKLQRNETLSIENLSYQIIKLYLALKIMKKKHLRCRVSLRRYEI